MLGGGACVCGPGPKAAESQARYVGVEAKGSGRSSERRPSGKGVVRWRRVSVDEM